MKEVEVEAAKNSLPALVEEALAGQPTVITRDGSKRAVILSYDEYRRLADVPSFGRLLAAFPGGMRDLPRRKRKPLRRLDL